MNKFKVTCGEKIIEYENPIRAEEVLDDFGGEKDITVMLCRLNGRLRELSVLIDRDCSVEWVSIKEKAGMSTYERGILMVFLKAVYKVGGSRLERCCVEYGLGRTTYCELYGMNPDEDFISEVKALMQKYVDENLPIIKSTVPTMAAREFFRSIGMNDKDMLFKFRRSSATNLYSIGNFTDYFFGYMPVRTGSLKVYDVRLYKKGVLLCYPDDKNPDILGGMQDRPKLYNTLSNSNYWSRMVDTANIGSMNEIVTQNKIGELVLMAEALQEKKMAEIAEMIKSGKNKKFVMIAGPSSSGKTTFSQRLSIQLKLVGLKPHAIGIDNYYKNREDSPKDENGEYDFECLEAIDLELFNRHMTALLNGETVEIPEFNFISGKKEYHGNYLTLGKDDILVIEGIHGLNDKLSPSIPSESKFKVYISALTQLNVDEHNRIATTDGRLIRRIVRDARTRGTKAAETIAMWPSVRRGEEKYIFPFQEEADVMFDSNLIYELGVLKQYAEPLLFEIGPDEKEYEEAKRLLKFLDYFLAVPSDRIPLNSIVREFIGGGCFKS